MTSWKKEKEELEKEIYNRNVVIAGLIFGLVIYFLLEIYWTITATHISLEEYCYVSGRCMIIQ